jgi:acyl-coenzyme A thioesterase PaaI-like protein
VIPSDRVASIREAYNHCFGCGTANPIGLGLDGFERIDNTVRATFHPRPDYHGFADLLHGGIVAAALDEIMAWTAILVEETMVMTGTLDLRYRKPARSTSTFDLVGELEQRRGRRLQISGTLIDDDIVIAQANGLFIAVEDPTAAQ